MSFEQVVKCAGRYTILEAIINDVSLTVENSGAFVGNYIMSFSSAVWQSHYTDKDYFHFSGKIIINHLVILVLY